MFKDSKIFNITKLLTIGLIFLIICLPTLSCNKKIISDTNNGSNENIPNTSKILEIKSYPIKDNVMKILGEFDNKLFYFKFLDAASAKIDGDRIKIYEFDFNTGKEKVLIELNATSNKGIINFPSILMMNKKNTINFYYLLVKNNRLDSLEMVDTNNVKSVISNIIAEQFLAFTTTLNNLFPPEYIIYITEADQSSLMKKVGFYNISTGKSTILVVPGLKDEGFFETKSFLYYTLTDNSKIKWVTLLSKANLNITNRFSINQSNIIGHNYESDIVFIEDKQNSELHIVNLNNFTIISKIPLKNYSAIESASKLIKDDLYLIQSSSDFLEGIKQNYLRLKVNLSTGIFDYKEFNIKDNYEYSIAYFLPDTTKLVRLVKSIKDNKLGIFQMDFISNKLDFIPINRVVLKEFKMNFFGPENSFPDHIIYYVLSGDYLFWNENYYNADTKISKNERFYVKFK